MNPDLQRLLPYPFERLAELKRGINPPADRSHIALSIGEPKHATPSLIRRAIIEHLDDLSSYPVTRGTPGLRTAIAAWLVRRYALDPVDMDPEHNVLPVIGTREALFAFAQCVVDRGCDALVMMPNPFYQIYEGAALLAGARPWFMNTLEENDFQPDLDAVAQETWRRCQLLYLCSPGNPTGAVVRAETLERIIQLADEHDFVIAADECYAEIYPDEDNPPPGLLAVARGMGRNDFRRCMVFHSLSKRSNAPGLRSGFVAGDAAILEQFRRYRTYHGCAMPPHNQAASIAAWSDEAHVIENRSLYREKFRAVLEILQPVLDVRHPDAGFYLWPRIPIGDTEFARGLFAARNVTVLPGSYLSRDAHGINPGHRRVRMALVAPLHECLDAARRIREYMESL